MSSVDAIERSWRRRRVAYYGVLVLLFAPIAFYFGPNVIMFGKLTWLAPADFVVAVERRCVPVVRAMKEFERDHGRRPNRVEELEPAYLPEDRNVRARVQNGEFECWTMFNHVIEYRFTPGDEGWYVRGVYTNGRIPYPPVTVGPATRLAATTAAATSPTSTMTPPPPPTHASTRKATTTPPPPRSH